MSQFSFCTPNSHDTQRTNSFNHPVFHSFFPLDGRLQPSCYCCFSKLHRSDVNYLCIGPCQLACYPSSQQLVLAVQTQNKRKITQSHGGNILQLKFLQLLGAKTPLCSTLVNLTPQPPPIPPPLTYMPMHRYSLYMLRWINYKPVLETLNRSFQITSPLVGNRNRFRSRPLALTADVSSRLVFSST